jgi:hypothetical protein
MFILLSLLLPPPGITSNALTTPQMRYKSPSSKRRDSARIAAWLSIKQASVHDKSFAESVVVPPLGSECPDEVAEVDQSSGPTHPAFVACTPTPRDSTADVTATSGMSGPASNASTLSDNCSAARSEYEGGSESALPEGNDTVACLLDAWVRAVISLPGEFGSSAQHFMNGDPCKTSGRHRDIFPICRIPSGVDVKWPATWSTDRRSAVLLCGNMSLASLSYLYGSKFVVLPGPPTKLQSKVHDCLLKKLVMMVG